MWEWKKNSGAMVIWKVVGGKRDREKEREKRGSWNRTRGILFQPWGIESRKERRFS